MVKMIVLTGKPSYGPNNIVKPNETAERGHNHLFSAVAGRVTTPTDRRANSVLLNSVRNAAESVVWLQLEN